MSARGGRALEPSSPASWVSCTTRQRSEQAYEVAAVVGTDELMVSFRGTARARRSLVRMPEGVGVECSFTLSDYNMFYGGIDRHDALVVRQERVLPEDVLR